VSLVFVTTSVLGKAKHGVLAVTTYVVLNHEGAVLKAANANQP
jgi:hypothetical protein